MRAVVAECHQGFYEHVNTLRDITVLATQSQLSIHWFADAALGETEYLAAGFSFVQGTVIGCQGKQAPCSVLVLANPLGQVPLISAGSFDFP